MNPSTIQRRFPAIWLVVPILFLAFCLRTWHLDVQSFWWDEAYSTMVASEGLRAIVATLAREDFHPPLHYFILHFWMQISGQSEFALRFVSVAAGVLTVAAAAAAAKRLFGRNAAPIAALIFGFSPFLFYYAQEARMFALVPLFGTLAIYFCARAVEDSRRWPWLAYTGLVTLGLYDFYYAIFLPFVCGLWVLLRVGRRWPACRDWAIATLAAFVLYVPWLPIFLSRSDVWASAFAPENGPVKVITWTWPEFVLGLPDLSLYAQPVPDVLLGLTALAALATLVHAWRTRGRQPSVALAALAFIVPFLTIAAIAAVKPVYHPRYAIAVIIGLYLAFAGLIDYLLEGGRGLARVNRSAGIALCALLVVCAGYGLYHLEFDPAYARDDYRDAIAYVQHGERPGDTVIDNAIPPFWYYYHGPAPASYFPNGPYTEADVATELNQVTEGRPRLWYVQHQAIPNDPDGFVDTQLRLHSQRLDERWFGAIRVQLWQISPGVTFAATRFLPVAANVANQLTLTGYGVFGDVVGGRTVDVELRWLVRQTPSANDGFWVALEDSAGRIWGRADTRPRDASYNLSKAWPVGENVVTRFDLPIAVGTPPGSYRLVAGSYRLSDLAGLNVLDAGQHPIGQQIVLGPLGVPRPTVGTTDPTLPNQLAMQITPALTLAADQLGPSSLAPGDSLAVTFLWRAMGTLSPLDASLRLQAPDGQIVVQDDRPLGDAFPTNRWQPGELVREQRTLKLPASAPAGPAALSLVLSNGHSIPLGSIAIARVVRDFTAPSTPHPLQDVLGGTVSLVGYDLSADRTTPGGQLTLTLDWKDLRATATSYHVFVHLLDSQDHIWAQWDGVPKNWSYPTSAWIPSEYVEDHYPLKLSPRTPLGNLTIEVGLYDATTGNRLPVAASAGDPSSDRVVLGKIQVADR